MLRIRKQGGGFGAANALPADAGFYTHVVHTFLHNTFIDNIQLCDGEGLVLDVSTRFKASAPNDYERLVRLKPASKHKTKKHRAAELLALLSTQGALDIEDEEEEEDEAGEEEEAGAQEEGEVRTNRRRRRRESVPTSVRPRQ